MQANKHFECCVISQ